MLKTKVKTDDVISVKMSTGEEVIAKFISEVDGILTVKDARAIVPQENGVALAPYLMTSSQDELSLYNFVTYQKTDMNVANAYRSQLLQQSGFNVNPSPEDMAKANHQNESIINSPSIKQS